MPLSLREFRAQYPQYNDIPDDDLTRRFHRKFYSEMPYEDFARQIGYTPTVDMGAPLPTRPPDTPLLDPGDVGPPGEERPMQSRLREFITAATPPPMDVGTPLPARPPDASLLDPGDVGAPGSEETPMQSRLRDLAGAAVNAAGLDPSTRIEKFREGVAAGQKGPFVRAYEGAQEAVGERPLGIDPAELLKYPVLQSPVFMLPAAAADAAMRTLAAGWSGAAGLIAGVYEQVTGDISGATQLQRDLNIEMFRRMGQVGSEHVAPGVRPGRSSPEEIQAFLGTAEGIRWRQEIDQFMRQREQREAQQAAPPGTPQLPAPAGTVPAPESQVVPPSAPSAPSAARPAGVPEGAVPASTLLPTEAPLDSEIPGRRLPSEIGVGQEPVPPAPVQGAGQAPIGPGGVLQTPQAGEVPNAPGAPVEPPRPTLTDIFEDPRPADAIRADLDAQQAAIDAQQAEAAIPQGVRDKPVVIEQPADVHTGAEITATPTPAQAEAGNYQKRHVEWQGLDIAIETEKGGVRAGVGPDGKPWSVEMPDPYGYLKRTKGKDGDELDVTVGPNPQAPNVFVIDQIDPATGKFDEHKTFIGYDRDADARESYLKSFSDGSGESRLGAFTRMSIPQFKAWLATGNRKPVSYVQPKKPEGPRGPVSAMQYLALHGGLKPDEGGELKALGLMRHRVLVPGLGYRNLVRGDGMSLDRAREKLVEAGYLQDTPYEGGLATTTPSHVLEILGNELRGQRVFRQGEELADLDEKKKREAEIEQEKLEDATSSIQEFIKEHGLLARDEQIREAAEQYVKTGEDPTDAIDRILERDALAEVDKAEQTQPQEPDHGAQQQAVIGATGTEGQARPPAIEQQAHAGQPTAQAPSGGVQPGQTQQAPKPPVTPQIPPPGGGGYVLPSFVTQQYATRPPPKPPKQPEPSFAGPRDTVVKEEYHLSNILSPEGGSVYDRKDAADLKRILDTGEPEEVAALLREATEQFDKAVSRINAAGFKVNEINSFNALNYPDVLAAKKLISQIGGSVGRLLNGLRRAAWNLDDKRVVNDLKQVREVLGQTSPQAPETGPSDSAAIELPKQMTSAALVELRGKIEKASDADKAAVSNWLKEQYAQFEKEGQRIAAHCQGGGA